MPKNIVILSDGTGQEGGIGSHTNVSKLFEMVGGRTSDQIAYYDRGLGTGFRKVTSNLSGTGISKNIQECYRFILDNFEIGDEIFLFGFSRGATTVRSLSSFIHHFGILPKARPELIEQAYKIYRISDRDIRKAKAGAFIARNHTMWCKIKFLGVWDTVAALGVPFKGLDLIVDRIPFFKQSFHDLRLSESVMHARHALAIDEERLTFHPILWDAQIDEDQTMKQVWFCGVHTDVGGGYKESELSDIALDWMRQEAKECGLKIYNERKLAGNADGKMHNSREGLSRLYRRTVRSWPRDTHGKPRVHASVLKRELNVHNAAFPFYGPWIFGLDCECEIEPWNESIRVNVSGEHLKILRQGAETWNRWREENPEIQPDLTNASLVWANLTERNLSGMTLTGADLRGANFKGADFTKTNLEKSKLNWADMSGSKLSDARLHKADLSNASLVGSDLSQAVLNEAFLTGTDLSEAKLTGADFRRANLNGADLSGADLSQAVLNEAFLTGTDLSEAKLTGADFRRANLNGADLSGAELSRCSIDEFTEYNDIIGCDIGVNGFWCKKTDSAALMTLSPPGNSMQGSNPDAVIESLKRARNLHAFSMSLAGLVLYIAILGPDGIKPPFVVDEKIPTEAFGLLAMLISVGILSLVTSFLADGLKGARYLQDRNSAMSVGNFPWVLSKYAGVGWLNKSQSMITRFVMSFHPIVYSYFWNIWEYSEIIYIILASMLLILSVWTFVLSQRFQRPILFDTKTEKERQNESNKLTRSVEELVSLLKREQAPDLALNINTREQPLELKNNNNENGSGSAD